MGWSRRWEIVRLIDRRESGREGDAADCADFYEDGVNLAEMESGMTIGCGAELRGDFGSERFCGADSGCVGGKDRATTEAGVWEDWLGG